QMDPAEVLAVEVKQYVGEGLKTLVPRVIGLTSEAERKKVGRGERQWDEASFFAELQARAGGEAARVARAILQWANDKRLRLWWGKGKKDGSLFPMLDHDGVNHFVVSVWTSGRLEIPFRWMRTRRPFESEAKRLELRDRLLQIEGLRLEPEGVSGLARISLSVLTKDAALKEFLSVLDWYIGEVRAA